MATNESITPDRLREVLSYDPATGEFKWLIALSNRGAVGRRAGTMRENGYVQIKIDGRIYLAQRLAFLWMLGRWPDPEADHRDTDPSNNAWENLRDATRQQQNANRRLDGHSATGIKGVTPERNCRNRWKARIMVDGVYIHLGMFSTVADAKAAYLAAATRHFGDFARG